MSYEFSFITTIGSRDAKFVKYFLILFYLDINIFTTQSLFIKQVYI